MTVYVDDFRAAFGRMVMCHMVADDQAELVSMARTIGVDPKWIQHPGTPKVHFDIALSKRALAVKAGAVEIEAKSLAAMVRRRHVLGHLGQPADAIEWLHAFNAARRAEVAA